MILKSAIVVIIDIIIITPILANSILIKALCLIRMILSILIIIIMMMMTIFCLLISYKIAPTMIIYRIQLYKLIVSLGLYLQDIVIFTLVISIIPLVHKLSITMSCN